MVEAVVSEAAPRADRVPRSPPRIVTATSLFDGHDAAINIMRRILQSMGAEVIHLGHNRSVAEIVTAAIEEDARAVGVSSYQGGHMEFYKYLVDNLRARGAANVRVFGGGGGVILPDEIRELEAYGVTRVYSPEDGQRMGLKGMIADLLGRCEGGDVEYPPVDWDAVRDGDRLALARLLSKVESHGLSEDERRALPAKRGMAKNKTPVLGVTGTGGSGKSSVTDELVRRFRLDFGDSIKIAIVAIDPSRKKSGGALLGDRIRMNAIDSPNIFMRSMATRKSAKEIPAMLGDMIAAVSLGGFDLIIVETPGIGQGDAGIVPYSDVSLYVMTPEYGAGSQLEKIDMLDYADLAAVNKFDRRGAQDAWHDVAKQVQRNRELFSCPLEQMPVFGTIASRVNDDGVTALYQGVLHCLRGKSFARRGRRVTRVGVRTSSHKTDIVPPGRQRYLAEIAECVRGYREKAGNQAKIARELQQVEAVSAMVGTETAGVLGDLIAEKQSRLEPSSRDLLEEWPKLRARYAGQEKTVTAAEDPGPSVTHRTLAGTAV
ncbi:MAG: cobalamin-dependent protein, partial [Pseudomonadota bacterium]